MENMKRVRETSAIINCIKPLAKLVLVDMKENTTETRVSALMCVRICDVLVFGKKKRKKETGHFDYQKINNQGMTNFSGEPDLNLLYGANVHVAVLKKNSLLLTASAIGHRQLFLGLVADRSEYIVEKYTLITPSARSGGGTGTAVVVLRITQIRTLENK